MNREEIDERQAIVADQNSKSAYRSTSIGLKFQTKIDPFLSLSWEHLTIVADIVSTNSNWFQRKERVILSKTLGYDLYGQALPGQIMAIMGNPGSGKTTLLKVLSGRRNETINVSGSIYLNGQEIAPTILMKKCGFIDQNETFLGSITVREHLTFQAMLRMPDHTDDYRQERILDVLEVLDLIQCQNTPIETSKEGKSLSNSELRRLTFGSIILTNPSILFIDEPTSKLDSYSSKTVMNSIRRLADQGKTLIVVLHRPSSQVFQMVDQLCLLTHGYLAYCGSRVDAQEFFSSMDRHCPSHYNPSEFYLEQLGAKDEKQRTDEENSVDNLQRAPFDWSEAVEHYRQSTFYQQLINRIEKKKISNEIQLDPLDQSIDDQTSFFQQTKWLFWRSFRSSSKTLSYSTNLSLKLILPAIILGTIFFQVRRTADFVQNINAVTFITLTTVTSSNAFLIVSIFPREFQVFLGEHHRRLYNSGAYFIAKIFSELPFFIVVPWLFTTVTYILTGFYKKFSIYLCYCFSVTLATIASNGFAGMITAATSTTENAVSTIVPIFEIFILFGGFFLNNATIPIYFLWLRYISWYYYAYSLILVVLWQDVQQIECHSFGFCLATGDDVLKYYDVSKDKIGFYLGMLVVLIVVYYLLTFLIICFRSRRR